MWNNRLILATALFVLGTIINSGAFFWMIFHALRRRRFEWLLVVFACPPIGLAQSSEVMDGNKMPIRLWVLGWVLAVVGFSLVDF